MKRRRPAGGTRVVSCREILVCAYDPRVEMIRCQRMALAWSTTEGRGTMRALRRTVPRETL